MTHRASDIRRNALAAIRAKLASARGESITEVLVAMVVAGFAILMLAATISSAASVNKQGREAMAEYYALNNALVQANAAGLSGGAAADIATATGTLSLTATVGSGDGAQAIDLSFSGENGATAVANVNYVVSQQMRGVLVASYERAAASASAGDGEGASS